MTIKWYRATGWPVWAPWKRIVQKFCTRAYYNATAEDYSFDWNSH